MDVALLEDELSQKRGFRSSLGFKASWAGILCLGSPPAASAIGSVRLSDIAVLDVPAASACAWVSQGVRVVDLHFFSAAAVRQRFESQTAGTSSRAFVRVAVVAL